MPRKPNALTKPRTECPFSGDPISIVQLSTGDWQIRGTGWIGTRLFQFKNQAEWWVSHNLGAPPLFPNPDKRVVVVEPPATVPEDEVTPGVEHALKVGEQLVEDAAKLLTR